MAKATIVSISPTPIKSKNPSMVPPEVYIPACFDEDKPVFVVINDAKTIEYVPLKPKGKGGRFNPVDGYTYAKSIVDTYLKSIIDANAKKGICPGVTVVEGVVKDIDAKTLALLKENQLRWKNLLVKSADDLWNKFRQRALISSVHVTIARLMKLDREWASEIQLESKSGYCPACMSSINILASICPHCRTIIDEKKYASFKKATA